MRPRLAAALRRVAQRLDPIVGDGSTHPVTWSMLPSSGTLYVDGREVHQSLVAYKPRP